jgi:large subunit ribosomal protein L25
MKTIAITGTLRSDLGKTGAKEARKNELVPCVMYGAGKQVHFTMEQKSFDKIIYTADVYNVLITVDGTEYSTFLKASQFHPVTDAPVHADFIILEDGKPVTVALPITLSGVAIGVKNGGKLQTPMRKVTVKGNLTDIPEKVEVDISPLKIGMSIKVGTMSVNGLEFLDPESNVVVAVKTARGAVDEDEEAEGEGAEEATPAEGAEA